METRFVHIDAVNSSGPRRFPRRKSSRWGVTLFLVLPLLFQPMPASAAENVGNRFYKTASGDIEFNTGVLKGKLRADGKSAGLSSVVHIPTGLRIDSSMGLLSHYRVFTVGKRYGVGAWDWPSEATLNADGSVAVRWTNDPERPFDFSATYRWIADVQVEVETVVKANAALSGFESFLACYFTKDFTNSLVCAGDPKGEPFVAATQDAGVWQAFPRDDQGANLIRDGRWKLEPHPVDWVLRPPFKHPIGVRGAPGDKLTAVLLSPPENCFAICTPHQGEAHYSTYFSLFGRDLKPGETARAKTLLIIQREFVPSTVLERFRKYSVGAASK